MGGPFRLIQMQEDEKPPLLEQMAGKWDRAVLWGSRPIFFVVCSEDLVRLRAQAQGTTPDLEVVGDRLTFRGTVINGINDGDLLEYGTVLVARGDTETINRLITKAPGRYQIGVLDEGGCWLVGTSPREVPQSD